MLALQETWLCRDELHGPNTLHNDFVSFSMTAMDDTQVLRRGRPYGGLTSLWHKRLSKHIRVSGAQNPRVLSITYKDDRLSILVNVHLPTKIRENMDDQAMCLGTLASLVDSAQEQHVCVLGDFNAAPGTPFFSDLQHMCEDRDMVVADVRTLPPTSSTHVNMGCLSRTWLDHVVLSPCLHNALDGCTILYDKCLL